MGHNYHFIPCHEYESWKHNLTGNASGWSIKYYKGLGTSTSKEGREYFVNLEKHRKDFIWEDEQDGEAIELAFSKKKIEERKSWLRQFEELEKSDAQSEELRKKMRGKARGEAAMKSTRQAPKNPRKNNNKKANNAESVAEAVSSSMATMEIESS